MPPGIIIAVCSREPMPRCIVCNNPQMTRQAGAGDFARFDCPRCGSFVLSEAAENTLERVFAEPVSVRRSLMSHTLRRMQRSDQKHLHKITSEELPTFWKDERLPTPLEQADNLILWIGDNQAAPAEWAETTVPAIAATIGIAVSREGNDGGAFGWLQSQLDKGALFRVQEGTGNRLLMMLEMAGWEKYQALKKQKVDSRRAFMALRFGQPMIDRMVEECARPAVSRTGFELRVLTDQQGAGLIDNQIRAALLSARFVISDLTHGSYGAYWEARFGEGRGIPVIYTCEKAEWERNKSHFDTNHMATIIWDNDDLKKAQDALAAMIRATLRAEAKQSDD